MILKIMKTKNSNDNFFCSLYSYSTSKMRFEENLRKWEHLQWKAELLKKLPFKSGTSFF